MEIPAESSTSVGMRHTEHRSQGSSYDSEHDSRRSTPSPEPQYIPGPYDRSNLLGANPPPTLDMVMSDPHPASLNIRVLETVTATFAWSTLVPASKMTSAPALYIQRNKRKHDDDWRERLSEALGYTVERGGESSRRSAPTLTRRRSLDLPPIESIREPSRTPMYDSRPISSPTTLRPARPRTPGSDYAMSEPEVDQFDDGEDEVDPPEPSPAAAARQILPSSSTPSQKPWHHYAKRIQTPSGTFMYLCLWGGSEGRGPCNYESKKQLVKRHIETTHLGIKPYLCQICKKSFPQKTHLEIHLNAHTKEKPYECMYEGCKEAFGDLSRRFKHYRSVHGYQPKQYKKKFKSILPPVTRFVTCPPQRLPRARTKNLVMSSSMSTFQVTTMQEQ